MKALIAYLLVSTVLLACPSAPAAEIDPGLVARAQQSGTVPVLIVAPDQSTPALAPMRPDADYLARRRALVASLRARADT
ncbi:MAG: hypothetical protein WBW92_01720, partial [Rhodanobacteraceae bacterium]